jgi:hypothetical protein
LVEKVVISGRCEFVGSAIGFTWQMPCDDAASSVILFSKFAALR